MSVKLNQGILVYAGHVPGRDQLAALLGMGEANTPAAQDTTAASDDPEGNEPLTEVGEAGQ